MKKYIIAAVGLIVLSAAGIIFIGRVSYPDNIAETSVEGGKKGLVTRFYTSDVKSVVKAVEELVPTLSTYGRSWELIDKTDVGAVSKLKVEVPVIVFTDDLEVTVRSADNEHEVRVDVRSQSRVGKSDFGENARHVRKFLNALDSKMK
jgi:uncharacterized protein (DUF1499 family)